MSNKWHHLTNQHLATSQWKWFIAKRNFCIWHFEPWTN